jgi:outer membrane protein assembly factor BamB
MLKRTSRCLIVAICIIIPALAEDWPEWRGKGRVGVWNESGILDRFPEKGLTVLWRTPIKSGYAGPAVAAGRVFVTDFESSTGSRGKERAICLDEKSGKILWTRSWEANYGGMMYPYGPRATPTVDGDQIYVVGAAGKLLCLKTQTGDVVWEKDYAKDYRMDLPLWGITGAPLVDGNRLIALVGGQPDAMVVAFDKMTGKEIWRALPTNSDPGYCQPVIFDAAGVRQLIIWHPKAVASLNPESGKVNWQQPFNITMGMTVATPVLSGSYLLVSAFYNGSMLLDLAPAEGVKVMWQSKNNNEINTDDLHAVINTPVIDGDYIYGICSYGQFRCLKLKTGERVWETMDVIKEKARWASGLIVRQGDRYFINNDRGELIIAKLSPQGYQEISRTQLIKPTTTPGNRRELGGVNWSQPAYANRCIYARNDEEIISASLAK